jgi:hypothetical protein
MSIEGENVVIPPPPKGDASGCGLQWILVNFSDVLVKYYTNT